MSNEKYKWLLILNYNIISYCIWPKIDTNAADLIID